MKKKRFMALLLTAVMAVTLILAEFSMGTAYAASGRVVTIGADLSAQQRASIFQFFGTSEDEVIVLTITNADEREHLGNLIPSEQIGWQTFSCAYVSPTDSNGIQVKTANMTYVTGDMIAATLSTSGVVNCDVLAAAPFPVSGTGALTGVIMAYETAIGEELDPEKKELANEELVTTGALADVIGQDEATLVVNDIKIRIIRDGAAPEDVISIVNDVLDNVNAAALNSVGHGINLSDNMRAILYNFAEKVASMGYDYSELSSTLQRVAQNVTESTGIEDPIMDTFEDKISNKIPEDSILNGTDDSALGLASNISTTFQDPADNEEVTFDNNVSSDQVIITGRGSVDSDNWVDNTSILEYSGNEGYGLMDIDGNIITKAIYTGLYGEYGYITGNIPNNTINCSGVLNSQGQEIIPFKYGNLDIENRYWAVCWELETTADSDNADARDWDDNYYNITNVDVYFMENDQADLVASLSRDQFLESYANGKSINITERAGETTSCYNSSFEVVETDLYSAYSTPSKDVTGLIRTFRANGQEGLMDGDGNVIMNPSFYSISLNENRDYIEVSTGSKEGLIDWDGNVMIPALYDSIEYSWYVPLKEYASSAAGYAGNGYVTAVDNGNFVFLDVNGNVTYESGYARDAAESYDICGASVLYEDSSGTIHILAADGVDTIVNGYYRVTPLYFGSGMMYKVQSEDYSYGLIDWHGNIIFEPKYDRISMSADGKHLLVYEYTAGTYIYDVEFEGPEYVPAEKPAVQVYEDDKPVVEHEIYNGNTGVYEYNTFNYNVRWISNGNYLYEGTGTQLEDIDGNLLSDPYDYFEEKYEEYIVVTDSSGGSDREGVLNTSGEEIIPVKYDKLSFESSHWVVAIELEPADEDEGDYKNYSTDSYMNITNADIYYMDGGTAELKASLPRSGIKDYYGAEDYIIIEDRDANVNVYNSAFEVVETGLYSVYATPESFPPMYQTYRDNGLYGIIDAGGNIILRAQYNYISIDEKRGLAELEYNDLEGLADLNGNILVPVEFDDIKNSYNMPLVKENGYSSYGAVSNGYVAVESDDKIGFCDINGNVTVPAEYPEDNVALGGASMLYTDDTGVIYLIAGDGVITELPSDYDYVNSLSYGAGLLYSVENTDYDYALMDWHGNLILPFEYGSMSLSANGEYLRTSKDGSYIIFKIDYNAEAAPEITEAEETEPESNEPAEVTDVQEETQTESIEENSLLSGIASVLGATEEDEEESEEETSAESEEPEEGSTSDDPVIQMLEGIIALCEQDFEGNKDNIVFLISQMEGVTESINANVSKLLGSTNQLIENGTADGNATVTLLKAAIQELEK